MNRNLSKRPKVVRKLDGALTSWRYFHGPNFVHEARDRLKIRTHSDPVRALLREATARAILIEENQALFAVLVAFVEWMQAPISPWAGSPFVEFVDETGTRKEARRPIADLGATVEKARSSIALFTSSAKSLGKAPAGVPKFFKVPR